MRTHYEEGHPARVELRDLVRANESTMATVKKFPGFLRNREFVFRQVFKAEKGKVFIAFESVNDEVDYGTKLRKVRALTRGFYCVEEIAEDHGGAHQSRVTLIQQVDFCGSIPTWVVNKTAPAALEVVQEAIDEFRQDERIDTADRAETSTLIKERWTGGHYSVEESALLQRVREKFEDSLKYIKWKQLKSPDYFVTMESTDEGERSCKERSHELSFCCCHACSN